MNIILLLLCTALVLGTTISGTPLPSFANGLGLNGRIVGGEEATPHEFPFIVNLRAWNSHLCGGAIINADWVITAAHCIITDMSAYTVTAGDHNNVVDEGTEQKRSIIRIASHPDHNPTNYSSDFCLLQVFPPFEFNEFVSVVQLPTRDFMPSGTSVTAGWGQLAEDQGPPRELYKVTMPLVENESCDAMYGDTGLGIDDTMICAGTAGIGGCYGDSGGPMICESSTGPVHCGVVSWARGCAREGYPEVYARTSYFLDYIEEITGMTF